MAIPTSQIQGVKMPSRLTQMDDKSNLGTYTILQRSITKEKSPDSHKIETLGDRVFTTSSNHQTSHDGSDRTYHLPSSTPFKIEEFLSPINFPHTIEEGYSLLKKAENDLESGVKRLLEVDDTNRTFANTVMAYHDMMIAFDAAERLIRSERLIDDESSGKQQLLDQFIAQKDKIFSNADILKTFIIFAEKTLASAEPSLSPFEMECLKGIINSIQEKNVTYELSQQFAQIKQHFAKQEIVPYVYLKGAIDSKVIKGSEKKFSCFNANLCMMPETNSMIYGGLLPWHTRVDEMVEVIKDKNPDMLFLQEVYDVRAIFELRERLADSYAHFYGNINPRLCGFSHESLFATSGLAVISKFKLANTRFEPYSTMTQDVPMVYNILRTLRFDRLNMFGLDKLRYIAFDRLKVFGFDRNYGIFHCDVDDGTHTPLVHVATTHLNPFFADVRQKQTEQIINLFTKLAANNSSHPFILCGDLNTQQNDLTEAGELLIQKHFIDKYQGDSTWNDLHDYWHKVARDVQKFLELKPASWTCDRSLLWSNSSTEKEIAMKTERVQLYDLANPDKALSDHHGIMSHIAI